MPAPTLRTASIEYAFSDPRLADIFFRAPQTLLDRDVVLFHPENVQARYASTRPFQGERQIDESDSPRIQADFARRRRELKALLERGGTLVVFLPAPAAWYVDTGERTYSGTGRGRQTTRVVASMELYAVFPFPLRAHPAQSSDLEVVGGEPFASFWRSIDGMMRAAAYLDEPIGTPTLQIRGSNAIVGSIAKMASGTLILLPQDILYEDVDAAVEWSDDEDQTEPYPEDVRFLDALFELVREVRVGEGEFSQPDWSRSFILETESAELEKVKKAEAKAEKAIADADKANERLALIQRRKTLFTGTGKAFETVVAEAFTALGFQVEEGLPGRADRIIRHPDLGPAVLEAKGKAKSAAEKDSAQLEKWASEYQLEHEEAAKPILVVNAFRDLPLLKRTQDAFPDQMLPYAEARGHCLVTGIQLLGAWLDAEREPSRAKEIATGVFKCVGRLGEFSDWRSFVAEPPQKTEEEKT